MTTAHTGLNGRKHSRNLIFVAEMKNKKCWHVAGHYTLQIFRIELSRERTWILKSWRRKPPRLPHTPNYVPVFSVEQKVTFTFITSLPCTTVHWRELQLHLRDEPGHSASYSYPKPQSYLILCSWGFTSGRTFEGTFRLRWNAV